MNSLFLVGIISFTFMTCSAMHVSDCPLNNDPMTLITEVPATYHIIPSIEQLTVIGNDPCRYTIIPGHLPQKLLIAADIDSDKLSCDITLKDNALTLSRSSSAQPLEVKLTYQLFLHKKPDRIERITDK